MGLFNAADNHRVPRLDFELTSSCDHKCGHCYNVWGAEEGDAQAGYPKGQLPTDEYVVMMERLIEQTGAAHITITGGEPLLHKGAMTIVERACQLVESVQIITNGSHIDAQRAADFAKWGVRSVQLTLLSADRDRHDALKGAQCFDDTVRSAVELSEAGVPVQVCFVAMAPNADDFEGVLELCFALGIRAVSYNRMSATGVAIHHLAQRRPDIDVIERHLAVANRMGPAYGIQVATAMPIPPCVIRLERYPNVNFGFCSVGTESPNIAVDALGNVRSCNLSAHRMGNALEDAWADIHDDAYLHTFKDKVPEMCRGCRYERSCQGGCKESGFAVFGDHGHPEPLLWKALAADG